MEEGHWFVSVYNDDGAEHDVEMVPRNSQVRIHTGLNKHMPHNMQELTEGCANGCHGHGDCVLGKCQCHPGFDGDHCSQSRAGLLHLG